MANLPAKISLSALLILLVFSLSFLVQIQGSQQREFDYFALALQWPGTFCQRTRHCCSSNGCCRGSNSPTEFTIHGLWPDYNDGTWPECCSRSSFNMKEISSLLGELQKYWPSLSCGSPSTCFGGRGVFWAHEWEKHGTCSSPVIHDEYTYFLTALNLYSKYNVTPRDCIKIDSASRADLLASRSSCPRYISLPIYVPLSLRNDTAAVPWLSEAQAL
ncbi:ribonuclease 2 isoform X4 [Telopea speciosissima]|uniref:ribonuclease 2 isoform X4 n=1 Tax=Telopea speciosissima TaxID=54955 RepID=UPI001CC78EBB|nr:ribonuclease 2 isoform X4 [Telopea speciosissima]